MIRVHAHLHFTDATHVHVHFDPAKHPRVPSGSSEGGEFSSSGTTGGISNEGTSEESGHEAMIARVDQKYPVAGAKVDGRTVREDIPNLTSISASLGDDYHELPGIRDVPLSEFGGPRTFFYAKDDFDRVDALAERIKESGEINPLIVVIDAEGPYVLEGAHRAVALQKLGAKSFPALVLIDTSDQPAEPAKPDLATMAQKLEASQAQRQKAPPAEPSKDALAAKPNSGA